MNSDSEKFDSLRRLLALKRHEQPPPGYFNRFSRDVMARIKAGEKGGEIGLELSWLEQLAAMFDVKPIFAGAFGTAVCALLVAGVISSERPVAATGSVASGTTTERSLATVSLSSAPAAGINTAFESTNPVAPGTSLFDQFQVPAVQREVSYQYLAPRGN